MKLKTILALITISLFAKKIQAQCVITPGCTPSTVAATPFCITPNQNTNLPNATTSTFYSTTMQLSVGGSSVNAFYFASSGTSSVSSLGLPAGLSFSVNPINTTIYGGSSACILLTGTPTTPGTYTITLVAADFVTSVNPIGGPYFFTWHLTINGSPTGIDKYSSSDSKFYIAPNPVESTLSISSESNLGNIEIKDALGRVVMSLNANEVNKTTINVEALTKGVYFLEVHNRFNNITRKFIKE